MNNIKQPKIQVFERCIKSDKWADGFKVYGLKYSDGTYSSNFGLDEEVIYEEIIFDGYIPPFFRILPKVEPQYLRSYMGGFNSQIVPQCVLKMKNGFNIATGIRGTCWNMYDRETYTNEGVLLSVYCDHSNNKDGIFEYITSLITKDDLEKAMKYEHPDV